MFVTAFYAVFNQDTGEFLYANAGHNPPLWIRGGKIERLTRTGMALGVLEANPISQSTIQLAAGESVFLYTDGLTEEFSQDGEIFGEARLLQAIQAASHAPANALLDVVEARLNEFIDAAPLADDLTMLIVMRK